MNMTITVAGFTIELPQIRSETLSQIAYNLSLMGFKVICKVEKEFLKGVG